MEHWIAENWGTVVTILSLIVGFAVSYGKLKGEIKSVEQRVDEVSGELTKLRDGGMPVLCRLHEERLTRLEIDLKEHAQSITTSVEEIKTLVRTNHDMLAVMQKGTV